MAQNDDIWRNPRREDWWSPHRSTRPSAGFALLGVMVLIAMAMLEVWVSSPAPVEDSPADQAQQAALAGAR